MSRELVLLGRPGRKVNRAPKGNRVMQDRRESQDRLAQQGLRVLQAQQDLAAQTERLAHEVLTAWLDLWVLPVLLATEDFKASQARQARTARLVRRGIPEPLARQGLRVL